MNYFTEIRNIVLQDLDENIGVVVKVFYARVGIDIDGYSGEFVAVIDLAYNPESFTKIEDLTEQIVIDWIDPEVTAMQVVIEQEINKQILEKRKNTRIINSEEFPWNQTEGN